MEKKIRKMVLLIFMVFLCGCSNQNPKESFRNELVKDYGFEIEDELKSYIQEHYDNDQNYSLGNGIIVLDFDGNSDTETQLFPVYSNESLIFLVLYGEEIAYITDPEALKAIEENKEYIILKGDNEVCFVSDECTVFLYGEMEKASWKLNKYIKKVRGLGIESNLMGIEKRAVKLTDSNNTKPVIIGNNYYRDRIQIRFGSGDIDSNIRKYEAFCHGKVQEELTDSNMYVFCFESLNNQDLLILLSATEDLDYVYSATLAEKTEETELATEIDLSQPVTEKEPFEPLD